MKTDGVDSSDDEVSTPEKVVKGKEKVGDIEDCEIVNLESMESCGVHRVDCKNPVGTCDGDGKVKRRLDDEFSTSCTKRKQKEVVVKKEKLWTLMFGLHLFWEHYCLLCDFENNLISHLVTLWFTYVISLKSFSSRNREYLDILSICGLQLWLMPNHIIYSTIVVCRFFVVCRLNLVRQKEDAISWHRLYSTTNIQNQADYHVEDITVALEIYFLVVFKFQK